MRTRVRRGRIVRSLAACLSAGAWLACASAGDPPGGPPDQEAPVIVRFEPDSGAVLAEPPNEAAITFDEVISERIAGNPPDIAGAVILSPTSGETRVSWKRDRLTARPREGFRPGIIYRLELLPVVTDLRQNRLRSGRTVVFSTGPAIPDAELRGAVVDWVAGRPGIRALVEAVLLPDSLPYRTVTDSTGWFRMAGMPAGTYLIYGVLDANGDRKRGPREAFDTVRVTADSATMAALYAFPHDTIAPRIRQVESVDSLTLRLTFDRPLDPALTLDTSHVTLATADDSTARLPLAGIVTTAGLDSLRARARREEEAARDSAAARAARERPADTAAAAPPARPARAAPAAPAAARTTAPGAARPPLDSTVAQRLLARRPPPSDVRYLLLAAPLAADTRHVIRLTGVRGLTGVSGATRSQIRLPRPAVVRRPPAAPADSAAPAAAADTTPRASARDTIPGR